MDQFILTDEQQAVIHHPLGVHARVLAVAGSGKSFTMACRIRHLVEHCQVAPHAIRVLMFNRLARQQFQAHLMRTGLPETLQPAVHTFHSFSFQVIRAMVRMGVLPGLTQFWTGDKEELCWLTARRAIENLERQELIKPASIEPEHALQAISLYKGALLPPERAGSWSSPLMPLVYAEFERLRLEKSALTFDDFIPLAIDILESNVQARRRWCGAVEYLIVDEYQDVNHCQQRLLELLADSKADVMAVGDDDQTIYEWRGARPNYIVQDFERVFKHKPGTIYRLSHSFRFGPIIAQAAQNLISQNILRVDKQVVAFQQDKPGFIQVYGGGYDANKLLREQVEALIQADGVPPLEIAVLSRLYAQMDLLEAEFLQQRIPYRVEGHEPFFKRSEIKTLLDYIRLARDFTKTLDQTVAERFMAVANKPNRMLSRALLGRLKDEALPGGLSLELLFERVLSEDSLFLTRWQREKLTELWVILSEMHDDLANDRPASEVLSELVEQVGYLEAFQNYYGEGEHADGKILAVNNFLEYVGYAHLTPLKLLEHIARLDTTQGAPIEEQVVFTTIFRTKGLEFDFVLLPRVAEGVMPYLKGHGIDIYDKLGEFSEVPLSDRLESERRLFYVALTRARKGVLIGTGSSPSRFLQELELEEPVYIQERRNVFAG